jgi:hypothetical protein
VKVIRLAEPIYSGESVLTVESTLLRVVHAVLDADSRLAGKVRRHGNRWLLLLLLLLLACDCSYSRSEVWCLRTDGPVHAVH